MDYISSKITHNNRNLYHTLIELYFRYCNVEWGQCGETQKDKLQTLQNKAKLQYVEADHSELLTEFAWLSVRNLIKLDTTIFVREGGGALCTVGTASMQLVERLSCVLVGSAGQCVDWMSAVMC